MRVHRASRIVLHIAAILFVLASAAGSNTFLNNGVMSAEFDTRGLVSLQDIALSKTWHFTNDNCSVTVGGVAINTSSLTPSVTVQSDNISFLFTSGNYQLKVIYELKAGWRFVSRRIQLTPTVAGTFRVNSVTGMTATVTESVSSVYRPDNRTGAAFLRFPSGGPGDPGTGLMLVQQNDFLSWSYSSGAFTMSYSPDMDWKDTYGPFYGDRVCIGTYQMIGYKYPSGQVGEWTWTTTEPARDGMDWAEIEALQNCIRAFLLFNPTKATRVDIGWCENDYQIDCGTTAGRTEYKRIIDRCNDLGIDNMLYTPANSLVSSLANNTDAWGWENVLWLALGQQIRTGAWICASGTIPSSIQEMLTYAQSKNVSLMAYAYPTLGFKQMAEWTTWCGGATGGYVGVDTGVRSFQDWFDQQLVDFHNHVGVSGYSFDHWWIAYDPPATSRYAQWYGCRRILENLRTSVPDIIIDGRQQYQNFGVWTWLAGTYPHPTSTDEQPGSFRAFPDLHTDRVSANRQRYTAYWFRMSQMAPPEITPGFITHQTQRYNSTGAMPRTTFRARDWDLLGWRFSLFSTIATAPFNLVMNMIPARDISEFNAMSTADKQFIKDWFDWVDAHIEYMRVIRPIMSQPMIGRVDGTAGILNDNGFVFLFNPNYRKVTATFTLDTSIGLKSGSTFTIKELEPRAGRSIPKTGAGVWSYGDTVNIPMDGTTAMVLEIDPASTPLPVTLFNVPGAVTLNGDAIQVTVASAETGTYQDVYVAVGSGTTVNSFTINGLGVPFTRTGDLLKATVRFDGTQFGRCQQIGAYDPNFTGTSVPGTFVIPQRIFTQLNNRKTSWPVTYTADDLLAPWLGSYRLLLYIHIADPSPTMTVSATINGNAVTVNKAYNGVYTNSGDQTFLGFYIDVSALLPDTLYNIQVTVPSMTAGRFQGLFFDNVETEYTPLVTDQPPPANMLVKLDAAGLPVGSLVRWVNTGLLGGSFTRDNTNPTVQNVAGRRAVVLGGTDRMRATFSAPDSITGTGRYTVAYWVHNPALSTMETVVSWAQMGTAGRGAQFGYGSSSTSGVVGHTGAADMGFNGGVPGANAWRHIAITYDGLTEKVYVDGVLNASETKTLNIWQREGIMLGCASALTDYFSGSIASLQIYDGALGSTDVATLANTWMPAPIVDLDASLLTPGALTTWTNNGTLGGSFGKDTTNPTMQIVSGRPAVVFGGADRMKSTFTSPTSISANGIWTYAAWVLNPALAAEECVFTWSHRGTNSRGAQMNFCSSTTYGAVSHYNLDMGFVGGIPSANVWHQIAVTFNGTTENVYVDGQLNATAARTLNIFAGDPMYVGCANTGTAPTTYFSGSVASLRMYDRALSAADIVALAAGPSDTYIGDLKGLANGVMVTLKSKTVTLAPRNDAGSRSTDYFYVEETDRSCGLRVQDALAGQDSVTEGNTVTTTGLVRTSATTGERYLELAAQPQESAGTGIKPFGITTKTLAKDQLVLSELVTIAGIVRSVAGDGKSFTIADGYMNNGAQVETLVINDGGPLVSSQISVGKQMPVIGVVSLQGSTPQTAQRVLLMKELPWAPPKLPIPPYTWSTSFESSEGYATGNAVGQQGWWMDWNPTGAGTVTIVTSAGGQVATGSQSLKLAQPNTGPLPWYTTLFVCAKNTTANVPNQAMKYLIIKMKLYFDGGTTQYPAGSGIYHPNTWFNQFGFYPESRYIDCGEVDIDSNFHALVANTTPRQVGDVGTPPIGGRWVEVLVYDDYLKHTRTMLYDGFPITSKAPISSSADRPGNSLRLYYGTAQPWTSTTGLSKPAYVDDIYVGWDVQ